MSKISNILNFISLLNTGKKFSIKELASELEVSERMVRKYKEELELAGIYITGLKGPYGGYVLEKKVITPIVKLNEKDIEILKDLNNKKYEDLITKLKIIASQYDFNTKPVANEKFNKIQQAIKEKNKIKIVYSSPVVGETERVIQPFEMFLFSKGWHVTAYCELRQGVRNFEIENIKRFEILNEKF